MVITLYPLLEKLRIKIIVFLSSEGQHCFFSGISEFLQYFSIQTSAVLERITDLSV